MKIENHQHQHQHQHQLFFKSYIDDHNSNNERYRSIINHIESKGHIIEQLHPYSSLPSSPSNEIHFSTIGSDKLLSNLPLLKEHIINKIPLIFFFITSFGTSNKPTNGESSSSPLGGNLFNLESTSPHTVDQTLIKTNEVTTDISVGVSFDGASFGESWSSTSSETQTITDYGINEMSNPVTMEAAWVYHQQSPFDVYTLGVNNFGEWYKQAFTSDGYVAQPPPLSISTLQTSTSWKWRLDNSLIDKLNNQLIVNIDLTLDLSYCLVSKPGFYDHHHKLFQHFQIFKHLILMTFKQKKVNLITK
ncbi:hypothetical protein ACTFIY_010631 [Dictyostelium cf. discoideum]